MKNTLKICFLIMHGGIAFSAMPLAEEDKVSFDFAKMKISVFGVYKHSAEQAENGIQAEKQARENAIASLKNYFKHSCDTNEKGQLGTKVKWDENFRSQGSTVYTNGYLKVTLLAPIRDVLKTPTKRRMNIKTEDDKKIAFSIQVTVPGGAIQCGSLSLNIGNNKKYVIYPADVVEKGIGMTLVNLVYDGKNDLKPATPEELLVLQKSSLAKEENVPAGVIPVTIVVPN